MGKYFGTDGFRGEANKDLTVEHAFKIGRYLGWFYGKDHKAKVVIGKDTRRSSYMFESALCAGLTASGADAYLLHVTTTPSVSYVARADDFDCGIMISASHNPYHDNGIKLLNGEGEKMDDTVLDGIEAYLDSGDVQSVISELAEKAMNSRTTVPDRLDDLIHTVACKAAIKAGRATTMLELQSLCDRVLSDDNVRSCPHGRPTTVRLTKYELDKMFKRVNQ
mgnify:CR=1 FL=1